MVEDTAWTVDDIAARFGSSVAGLVGALTEDGRIEGHRRRKHALRDQIAAAGAPATDIALADKIASLRYLRVTGRRLPKRKRAHYGHPGGRGRNRTTAACERGRGPAGRARGA